jgi:hypothetical protein
MQMTHGFVAEMTHDAVVQAYNQIALVVGCFGQDLLPEWNVCLVPCRVGIGTFQEPFVDLAAGAIIESFQTTLYISVVLRVSTEIHCLRNGKDPWSLWLGTDVIATTVALATA